MMTITHFLRLLIVFLALLDFMPFAVVTALPAMSHYTIGLWANGELSSQADGAQQTAVMHVSATASVPAMLASVTTTNCAERASFTIILTPTPLANTFSTSISASSSYITEAVLYSSVALGEPTKNQNIRIVVGIIVSCVAGGLFLAAAVHFLVRWVWSVLPGRTLGENTTADRGADCEQEVTTSDNSTVSHSDKSDASSATKVNSTITSTSTPKSKKRHGMVIDTVQCYWLAEQDHHASNTSTTAKGLAGSPPCLSPLAPMSPFFVFDIVKRKAEIAAVEKQNACQEAYLKLNGDA